MKADPSAWNGLGNIAMLKGNPQLALQYIDQAIQIEPGYADALRDREGVRRMLKAQENQAAKQHGGQTACLTRPGPEPKLTRQRNSQALDRLLQGASRQIAIQFELHRSKIVAA
jgi:hypothetical protein